MTTSVSQWFAMYPYGGGGPGCFGPLNAYLGAAHRHVPVYPGRDLRYREPGLTTFASLADEAWTQLQVQLGDRSAHHLVVFGYSLGGMVAAEMARRLQAEGTPPRALVVAGAAAPTTWRTHGLVDLDDDAYVARLKTLGVAPPEVLDDPVARPFLLPIWRADGAVAGSVPVIDEPFACPVHAIAGRRDPLVDSADLEAWVALGGPGSTAQLVAGDHGSLIRNPVVIGRALLGAALASPATDAGAA